MFFWDQHGSAEESYVIEAFSQEPLYSMNKPKACIMGLDEMSADSYGILTKICNPTKDQTYLQWTNAHPTFYPK